MRGFGERLHFLLGQFVDFVTRYQSVGTIIEANGPRF